MNGLPVNPLLPDDVLACKVERSMYASTDPDAVRAMNGRLRTRASRSLRADFARIDQVGLRHSWSNTVVALAKKKYADQQRLLRHKRGLNKTKQMAMCVREAFEAMGLKRSTADMCAAFGVPDDEVRRDCAVVVAEASMHVFNYATEIVMKLDIDMLHKEVCQFAAKLYEDSPDIGHSNRTVAAAIVYIVLHDVLHLDVTAEDLGATLPSLKRVFSKLSWLHEKICEVLPKEADAEVVPE
jgi:transcription initiation factor TFIIIB Brf1 subunit/transcription initiation factor TFIIB